MTMSIRTRLVVAVCVQLLLMIAVGSVSYLYLNQFRYASTTHEESTQVQIALQRTLRGVGEMLLTEGSLSSRQLTQDNLKAVDDHLGLLLVAAVQADTEIAKLVKDELTPQWGDVRGLVEQMLGRKKVSPDSTDAMILYGKLSGTGSKLSENAHGVVTRAEAAGRAKMRQVLLVLGLGSGLILISLLIANGMLLRKIMHPLSQVVAIAERVGDGDISSPIDFAGQPHEMIRVLKGLSDMQSNLASVVTNVRNGSDSLATASSEIAQGNQDLSDRTARQSIVLAQAASSMEQLGFTVRQNVDSAHTANQLALTASSVAVQGGEVVERVVETMRGINDSSRKISDIISVIDGIAFQTNILALNAAVEAARAGEQGRGFAVVASEVRSLAGRSAQAAKEIKALINTSVERVSQGSSLADQAGATMTEVVNAIKRVTDIMGEINAASDEQAAGVSQVGDSVAQMDITTQQNAALVEEMAAAATGLSSQAQELVQTVSRFQLD